MKLSSLWQRFVRFYVYHVRMILRHRILKIVPIIIYQPGKVGSSTIYESLRDAGSKPVYQVHYLNQATLETMKKEFVKRQMVPDVTWRFGQALARHVIEPRQSAQIITLVRDPIARNLSDFYQNFRFITGRNLSENIPVDEMQQLYLNFVGKQRFWKWYASEMKDLLNIDIYDKPFPHDIGYLRWQSGIYDVLLLKIETEDQVIESALSDFTGYSSVQLRGANQGGNKDYADSYRALKRSIRLPHDYLHTTLDTQYARHFYTDAEREAIYQRWIDPETIPSG